MAGEKKETVTLVGEGGSTIEMEFPLPTVYIEQINKGTLSPVDEKEAVKLAEAGVLQGSGGGLAPSATVERMRALEAREEAVAAKEAELAAREQALADAAAEADKDAPSPDGGDGSKPPADPAPGDTSGPRGKGK